MQTLQKFTGEAPMKPCHAKGPAAALWHSREEVSQEAVMKTSIPSCQRTFQTKASISQNVVCSCHAARKELSLLRITHA
jgi:hypothetical protein